MVLPLPRWLSGPLAAAMIVARSTTRCAKYRALGYGGGSPQLATGREPRRTAGPAASANAGWTGRPAVAMRYWHPFTAETVAEPAPAGARQYCWSCPPTPSTAWPPPASLIEFDLACWPPTTLVAAAVHVLREWPLLPATSNCWPASGRGAPWPRRADPAACALVYTAHSLPERFHRRRRLRLGRRAPRSRAVHARPARVAGRPRRLADPPGRRRREPFSPSRARSARSSGSARPRGDLPRPVAGGVRRLARAAGELQLRAHRDPARARHELARRRGFGGRGVFSRGAALNLDPGWLPPSPTASPSAFPRFRGGRP